MRPNGGIVQGVGPGDVVVSVTLRLQRGLDYQGTYRLRVSGAVEDLDTTPRALQPEYTSAFTTFGPKDLQVQTEKFSSPGLVVLGDQTRLDFSMETPCVSGLQQVPEAVPLAHRPNTQLALFDGDVQGRTCGHFRLDGE